MISPYEQRPRNDSVFWQVRKSGSVNSQSRSQSRNSHKKLFFNLNNTVGYARVLATRTKYKTTYTMCGGQTCIIKFGTILLCIIRGKLSFKEGDLKLSYQFHPWAILKDRGASLSLVINDFVLKCQINNIHALIKIMDWRRPGDKPWFEPMIVRLLTHICVSRPQRLNHEINTALWRHRCYKICLRCFSHNLESSW